MKIIVFGAGPDRIGKTGELDRFAIQGIRFLKEEGNEIIWVDNNPVTLASVSGQAHRVYLEPLTLNLLEKIIEQERPDGIMHAFGGCLAMHLAIFLDREGVLDRYGVKVLGTSVSSLKRFMDSELFKKTIRNLGVPVMDAVVVRNVNECYNVSRQLGFPVILRPAFALEGIGGYVAYNIDEVKQLAQIAFNLSPVQEVVTEQAPVDWIQFALEGIHDPSSPGDVHLVGTFEAMDGGVGVHPGNSVVVAPALTLKNDLLEKALNLAGLIAGNMGICGTFQVRFATSENYDELVVLRVIYGLNRFSSFFSLLRSAPLAEINAAMALGYTSEQLKQKLDLSFLGSKKEGTLSAVRVPIFPGEYPQAGTIDSTMRSTGAVLLAGETLSMAFAKALDLTGMAGSVAPTEEAGSDAEKNKLTGTSTEKLLKLLNALTQDDQGVTGTPYVGFNLAFLSPLKGAASIIRQQRTTPGHPVIHPKLTCIDKKRPSLGASPSSVPSGPHSILFLGPGPYKISWGPEMDWALIRTAMAFKEQGRRVFLINHNPDAVSQEPEVMDAICLDMPSLEVIESAIDRWSVDGIVHQFCLDLPEGLEVVLKKRGVEVLGTSLSSLASVRNIPSLWETLREIGIPLPSSSFVPDPTTALNEAERLGYPVLARLGDVNLNPEAEIIYDEAVLSKFMTLYRGRISAERPMLMESFQEGMLSAQVLAICDGKDAIPVAFFENIEEYGVHSGDCATTIPTLSIGDFIKSSMEEALKHIVIHFNIVGHLQLELAIKGRNIYVTDLWPYPGRNMPFAEKAIGGSVHEWVSRLLLGESLAALDAHPIPKPGRYSVKESVFPFSQLPGLNPVMSPRMQSTGQVLGIDDTFGRAYFKSQMAVNPRMPSKGKAFLSARDTDKEVMLQVSKKLLALGFSIVSTQGTAQFLARNGVAVSIVHKVSGGRPNIIDLIINGDISLVINIPGGLQSRRDEQVIHRAAIEHNIPLVTTTSGAFLIVKGIEEIQKSPFRLGPLEA